MRQLRYFLAIARTGSFTQAAEMEGVSQPTLSQQISKLERGLGVPLFERRGRSVGLTLAGEALLPQARAALRCISEARQTVECIRSETAGRLAVGCIPTITPYFLAPRIAEFQKRYPDVELILVENVTSRLLDGLLEDDLDLAVLSLPVRNQDLVISELFRERLMLAVPPGHALAGSGPVDLKELRGQRMLALREGHCFRENALEVCRRARIDTTAAFETDQFASIFALVEAGLGLSIVPELSQGHAGRCSLVPLRTGATRRIGYARRRRQFVPPAQKAFVAWLRECRR